MPRFDYHHPMLRENVWSRKEVLELKMTDQLPLLIPARRQPPFQFLKHQRLPRPPLKNRFDNIGCQERQPQDAAHIRFPDPLRFRDLGHRTIHALIEHALPPPSPRQRLDECAVGLWLRAWRKLTAIRRDDALTTAAALECMGMRTTNVVPSSLVSMSGIMPPSFRLAVAARLSGSPVPAP